MALRSPFPGTGLPGRNLSLPGLSLDPEPGPSSSKLQELKGGAAGKTATGLGLTGDEKRAGPSERWLDRGMTVEPPEGTPEPPSTALAGTSAAAPESQDAQGAAPAPAGPEGRAEAREPGATPAGSGTVIAMQHQSPGPDCPICPLSGPAVLPGARNRLEQGHSYAFRAWEEWNPAEPARTWAPRVQTVLSELGIKASVDQIVDHFNKHRIEQPAMPGNLDNELYRRQAMELKQRQRDLLNALYCQRVLTSGQIREVFYRPGRRPEAAKKAAQLDLRPLCQGHYLYRVFPNEKMLGLRNAPAKFATTTLWFLGKRAVPFIQAAHELSFQPPYANGVETISTETLIHDIRANEVFVSLARTINKRSGKIFTSWGEALVGYDPMNWYGPGPRSLAMGFGDPLSTDYLRIKPDGMATISLLHRSDEHAETMLPFFIEYDHGTKDVRDVAQQLFVYHLLAKSGAVGKRFPQLDVEGYAVPVIMVFSDPKQREAVHKRFLQLAEETGVKRGAPILLADEEAWSIKPFAPGVCRDAWQENVSEAFLEVLLRSARPLAEKRPLPPGSFLQLDPTGAPARAAGAGTAAAKAEGREILKEKREAEERAERQAAVDRAIAERIARKQEETGEAAFSQEEAPPPKPEVVAPPPAEAAFEPAPAPAPAPGTETIAPQPPEPVAAVTPPPEPAQEPVPAPEAPAPEAPAPAETIPETPAAEEQTATPATEAQPPVGEVPLVAHTSEESGPESATAPVDPLDPFAAGPSSPEDEVAALKRELAEIKQTLAGGAEPARSVPPQAPAADFIPGLQPAAPQATSAPAPPEPLPAQAPEEPELPDPAELLARIRDEESNPPETEPEAPASDPYVPAYAETAEPRQASKEDIFPDLEAGQPATPVPGPAPVTQPPVTQPPVTQPPVTQPPVTQPPATQPPVTQPPASRPPANPFPPQPPSVMDRPIGGAPLPPIPEPPAPREQPAIDDESAAARRRARRRRTE